MGSKIARRQVKFKQKSLTPSKKNLKKKPTQNQINKQHCTCTKKKKKQTNKKTKSENFKPNMSEAEQTMQTTHTKKWKQ